ncbi:hypothetical protein quinque_004246 [Culex quinquefasciatus]
MSADFVSVKTWREGHVKKSFIYLLMDPRIMDNMTTQQNLGEHERWRKLISSIFYTFCVVSKRFRKNYIHRFTGTKSLFCFTPWSPTRRACVYLATNQFFDYFVMATILFNCIFLAMSETIEEAE